MEAKYRTGRFGGSMPVQSVQALAARLRGEIPARYIRPEFAGERVISADNHEEIPVIDLGKLLDPNFSKEEAAKLQSACVDWGFFTVTNHGVSVDIINKLNEDITDFFKLPLEEKEKIAQTQEEIEGYGNAFVQSEEQKLDWGDSLFLTVLPPQLRLTELWPVNPPSFKESLCNYSLGVKRVTHTLLNVMSKNLGLVQENLPDIFKDGFQFTRINYYPPCPHPDKAIGLSPHSDSVGLTVLLQLSEVQGLQIRRERGWLPVQSFPGDFIVNIGDVIEILSNGKYKSIEHRAVLNNEVERLSIAAFHTLNFGDVIGPISELVEGGKPHFVSLEYQDYMKKLYTKKLEGKKILDCMRQI